VNKIPTGMKLDLPITGLACMAGVAAAFGHAAVAGSHAHGAARGHDVRLLPATTSSSGPRRP